MTLDGGSLIYWASTLHSHHWPTNIADEEAPVLPSVPMSSTVSSPEPKPSVPTSKANLGTELMLEYVTESSLATPEQHPLVIRPVYKEIETRLLQHIKQKQEEPERRAPGLLIFGHSGTGKSICLWYLLFAMLRLGRHVFWAPTPQRQILFTEDGATDGPSPDVTTYLRARSPESPPLVVLWDASAGPVPRDLYADDYVPNHVVVTWSPNTTKLKGWTKLGVECITVDCFSREEVEWFKMSGQPKFQPAKGCYDMLTVYDYLGPSLHTVLHLRLKIREGVTPQEAFATSLASTVTSMRGVLIEERITAADNGQGYDFENLAVQKDCENHLCIFKILSIDAPGSHLRFANIPRYTVHFASDFVADIFQRKMHRESF